MDLDVVANRDRGFEDSFKYGEAHPVPLLITHGVFTKAG